MPLKSVIRASCVVGVLLWCGATAAERKPALIGATRDEVLARLGEPKSNIVAGSREVLFFTGERIVLRNNRVVEVEDLPTEAPPAPAKPAVSSGQNETATESSATAPKTGASTSAADAMPNRAATAASSDAGATAAAADTATQTPVAPPEPEVIIKSVRPPSRGSAGATDSTAVTPRPAAVEPAAPLVAAPEPAKTPTAPLTNASGSPASVASSTTPTVEQHPDEPVAGSAAGSTSVASDSATAGDTIAATESTTESTEPAQPVGTASAPAAKTTHATPHHESEPEFPSVSDSIFTKRTYLLGLLVIGAGTGYLVWRRRNKQLILAATAVSHSPFTPEPAAAPGTRFTQDLLNKLEWKRFEELVAAYYNKTGVVASRTKSGPGSPVHIRISWKGEQRPFACVHCVAQPTGLIGPQAVQSLCEVLAAEDIRRGYVVTSGRFGVPARDLAEEKQVTLLSGDIFLEKLNALPDPARTELMRDASAGDYITPTCPRCETKMSRSPSDPTSWQCPQCGTVLPKL